MVLRYVGHDGGTLLSAILQPDDRQECIDKWYVFMIFPMISETILVCHTGNKKYSHFEAIYLFVDLRTPAKNSSPMLCVDYRSYSVY